MTSILNHPFSWKIVFLIPLTHHACYASKTGKQQLFMHYFGHTCSHHTFMFDYPRSLGTHLDRIPRKLAGLEQWSISLSFPTEWLYLASSMLRLTANTLWIVTGASLKQSKTNCRNLSVHYANQLKPQRKLMSCLLNAMT